MAHNIWHGVEFPLHIVPRHTKNACAYLGSAADHVISQVLSMGQIQTLHFECTNEAAET